MPRNPYKKRIEVLIDIWSKISEEPSIERAKLVEVLRKAYAANKLEPLRGKALPPDIYDKELSSLYAVGKYGLGMDTELPEVFEKALSFEKTLDEVAERVLRARSDEEAVRAFGELKGDPVLLARLLRLVFTEIVLGFRDEDDLRNVLHRASKVSEEFAATARKFARFYIAFRTAEAIAKGIVRNKKFKEAFKQALSVKLGIDRVTPDDEYVYSIAKAVFKVPDKVLSEVLNVGQETKPRVGAEQGKA